MPTLSRRQVLCGAAALSPLLYAPSALAVGVESLSDALFEQWTERARLLSAAPYAPLDATLPADFANLDYDAYRRLRPRSEAAIWGERDLGFAILPLPRGHLFRETIDLSVLEASGPRTIAGAPFVDFVDYPNASADAQRELGISGWRLLTPHEAHTGWREFAVFQGGVYFRAVADALNYGLSARALSLFTASGRSEEFPHFREFLIVEPQAGAQSIFALALLDSASITGAYELRIEPGRETFIDVRAQLFPRVDLSEIGIGAMSSMFARGGAISRLPDRRPRVHDSDGLLISTRGSERIWRPLTNPTTLQVSQFQAEHIDGFGLIQRERDPASFLDSEARYEARPSLWVTPGSDWPEGHVVLAEIPTDSEYHDNIAAFWRPSAPWRAQTQQALSYRLTWNDAGPRPDQRAPIVRTQAIVDGERTRFAIDFAGASAATAFDLWSSAGELADINLSTSGTSATLSFALAPDRAPLIELRAALKNANGQPASETWLYRWTAP